MYWQSRKIAKKNIKATEKKKFQYFKFQSDNIYMDLYKNTFFKRFVSLVNSQLMSP